MRYGGVYERRGKLIIHADGKTTAAWGTFVKGALLTNVEADDVAIRLLPQENRGGRDGFQPGGLDAIAVAATASDEELGSAVLNALKRARESQPLLN